MATVAFYPLHEPGHIIPTLPLARRLAARGHRVVYATTFDLGPLVVAQGFEHVPVLRDVYPAGHATSIAATPLDELEGRNWMTWSREDREVFDGGLVDQLLSTTPDVVMIDIINTFATLAVRERGVPLVRYSTSLSQRLDNDHAITTATPYDAPPSQREAARSTSGILAKYPWYTFDHGVMRFAAEDLSFATTFTPDLASDPELVLPPSALDFPRSGSKSSINVGLPVDLERVEHVDPTLERFLDGRPVVYVSLGSQAHRYPAAAKVVDAVLAALRTRTDWLAVVVVGERLATLAPSCPPNVLLVKRAPQLWVLRRSAVFVTHGGMGALREAIALCVPMIVIPHGFDQPGNAARMEYHGLGVHLPEEVVDPARLIACIDRVFAARAEFHERLRQIERACAAEAERDLAVQIVEQRLAITSAERPPARPDVDEPLAAPQRGWLWLAANGSVRGRGPMTTDAVLAAGPDEVVGLGRGGFTMCPDFAEALARAEGPWLWSVEVGGTIERTGRYVTGSTLRGLWRVDTSELLVELALRCVELALVDERTSRPEVVDYFMAGIARHRSGTDLRAELTRVATPWFHHGFDVALEVVLSPPAHQAATLAREMLIHRRCREALRGVARSTAAYNQVRARVVAELDADLFRTLTAVASRQTEADIGSVTPSA